MDIEVQIMTLRANDQNVVNEIEGETAIKADIKQTVHLEC
jgi:hypothetical protein